MTINHNESNALALFHFTLTYLIGKFLLPCIQYFSCFLWRPTDIVHLPLTIKTFEHFTFRHQLDDRLQCSGSFQMARSIAFSTANNQFFWPMHILCCIAVTTASQFSTDVHWGFSLFIWRCIRTKRIIWIETGLFGETT